LNGLGYHDKIVYFKKSGLELTQDLSPLGEHAHLHHRTFFNTLMAAGYSVVAASHLDLPC
jgi:hypothetical protein